MRQLLSLGVLAFTFTIISQSATGEELTKDWPQWRGPDASGVAADSNPPTTEILLQVNGAASLLDDELAKKLSITEEQKDKLMEVSRANAKIRRESNTNLRGSNSPTTVKELVEENDAGNKKLLEVLSEEQRKQFIEMQGKKLERERS